MALLRNAAVLGAQRQSFLLASWAPQQQQSLWARSRLDLERRKGL